MTCSSTATTSTSSRACPTAPSTSSTSTRRSTRGTSSAAARCAWWPTRTAIAPASRVAAIARRRSARWPTRTRSTTTSASWRRACATPGACWPITARSTSTSTRARATTSRSTSTRLFGRDCFLNEIVWAYDYGAKTRRRWPAKHDTILVYVKDRDAYHFDDAEVERIPYLAPALVGPEKAARGKRLTDTWFHTIVPTNGAEKTGYPTQKPEGVVRRMVAASSRPGGWCLDFFAGSGTLGAVAARARPALRPRRLPSRRDRGREPAPGRRRSPHVAGAGGVVRGDDRVGDQRLALHDAAELGHAGVDVQQPGADTHLRRVDVRPGRRRRS